jgi:hypothetical protein
MIILKVLKTLVTFKEFEEEVTPVEGTDFVTKPARRAKRGVLRLYNKDGKIADPRTAKVGNKKMFIAGKEPHGINVRFTDIKCVDLKTGKECLNLYEMEVE